MKKFAKLMVLVIVLVSFSIPAMGCDDYVRTYEDDWEWEDGECTPDNNWDDWDSEWVEEGDPIDNDRYPDIVDESYCDDSEYDYDEYDEWEYEDPTHQDFWCDDVEPMYMVAICSANVRSGPGTCYAIVDGIAKGEDVVVIGEAYDCNGKHWYKCSDGNYITAGALVTEYEYTQDYQCSESTETETDEYEEEDCSVKFYKTVQVGANVRKGPGTCYSVIDGVSAGESVGIYYEKDGWYYTDRGGWIAAYLFDESYHEECHDESSYCDYDTCIVIVIEEQMVYVYKDGDLICSSPCVTGDAGSKDTPKGEFAIQSKEVNRDLVGEDYSSHVDYWMPFYDGCGLHDASWRDDFGGDIYQGSGSHGCVNLPHDVAELIYNNVSSGTPVIVK